MKAVKKTICYFLGFVIMAAAARLSGFAATDAILIGAVFLIADIAGGLVVELERIK